MVKLKGLNFSAVREEVFHAALRYKGHFSVNDLVNELRDAGVEGAHLTTVYRTMPLLVEAGIIQSVLMSSGDQKFYETAFDREHHDHLVCTQCGKIVEFHFEALEALQRDVASRYGFELTSHVHELLGRCEDCRRAEKTKGPPVAAKAAKAHGAARARTPERRKRSRS